MIPGPENLPHIKNISAHEMGDFQDKAVNEGQWALAEQALKLWLPEHDKDPESPIRRLELSRVLFWRGKPSEAEATLLAHKQDYKENSYAYSLLGQVSIRKGDFDTALRYFNDAVRMDPDNHEAVLFLDNRDETIQKNIQEYRGILEKGSLSARDRIHVAATADALLFQAWFDNPRDVKINWEDGFIFQQTIDRANLMLDYAEVGDEVDSETTLRRQFNESDRVIFFTSTAMGDALLGMGGIQAVITYMERHPEHKRKRLEIVTPYGYFFEGLKERYPYIEITQMGKNRDRNEAKLYAEHLKMRQKNREKLFVFTNGGSETSDTLFDVRSKNTVALLDAFVNRFSHTITPWQSPRTGDVYSAYPARMFRFMEMMLGEKLVNSPKQIDGMIPIPQWMQRAEQSLREKYHFSEDDEIHTVVESASVVGKKFSDNQLRSLLERVITDGSSHRKIAFIRDPGAGDRSFASRVNDLPEHIRSRIIVVQEDLPHVGALIHLSASTISPDTGLAHLSSLMGTPTLIVTTLADPDLWQSGGRHVRVLASPEAYEARDARTPVNEPKWSRNDPIAERSFDTDTLFQAWKDVMGRNRKISLFA